MRLASRMAVQNVSRGVTSDLVKERLSRSVMRILARGWWSRRVLNPRARRSEADAHHHDLPLRLRPERQPQKAPVVTGCANR